MSYRSRRRNHKQKPLSALLSRQFGMRRNRLILMQQENTELWKLGQASSGFLMASWWSLSGPLVAPTNELMTRPDFVGVLYGDMLRLMRKFNPRWVIIQPSVLIPRR